MRLVLDLVREYPGYNMARFFTLGKSKLLQVRKTDKFKTYFKNFLLTHITIKAPTLLMFDIINYCNKL